jgi:PAS domain S-box-containing protein
MPQMVWATRPDGRTDYQNARWYEFTGLAKGADDADAWASLVHPNDMALLLERWQHSQRTRALYEVEHRLRRRDGAYRWVLARAVPILDGQGRIVRWFGTLTDIEEIVEAREVLARSRAELERLVDERTRDLEETQARLAHARRMEALGQLAGGIAHDFNNVLQTVQGSAELIERRAQGMDDVRRLARMVGEAAERGSTITRRLLAFSRRGELRAEAVDAAALLGGVRDILGHTLGGTVEVRVEAEPGLPMLLADKGQLETVLVNLATNARDAMPSGGTLTFSAALAVADRDGSSPQAGRLAPLKAGRYVRLSAVDTGEGMTPEILAHVTEPFFTTKQQGRGTGLGLAMAKGFAEQSGGALGIESTPARGTTVTLWLPVTAQPQAAVPVGRDDGGPARGDRRARILLVDDDPIVREVTAEQLEAEGYAVLVAESGAAALEALDAGETVDLVVSDLSMPGLDGIAVIREAQRRKTGLPAILLTGFATDAAELAVGGALSGTFSLLRKPVMAEQISERVETLLETATVIEGVSLTRGP